MLQIGAFPYLFKKEKLYIMLIMNSARKHWILPKGNTEDDMKSGQVAELEALEEAGVKGKILSKKIYREFDTEHGGTLRFYPMPIEKILEQWPEDYFRRRKLVDIEEALSLVTRSEHRKAIKYFSDPDKSPIFDKNIKDKDKEKIKH